MQGLCSASVHLYVPLFVSDEMRRETCIICNRYRSLMCLCSPWQPIMGHFWGSQRLVWLCDGDGMGTAGVTWEETRRTMGPFILLVRKLALRALDMVCIQRVLVLGVADNDEGKNCPSKGKQFILSFMLQKQRIKGECYISKRGIKGACIK